MTNTKETNPKDAIGCTKPPLSTLSMPVLFEMGNALLEGACKYGRHNYRRAGVRGSIYFDAAMRHLAAWWEGQNIDPDSGLSHVTKAMASLMVLRDSMLTGNWADDRPPQMSGVWMDAARADTKAILHHHPEPKAPHTELDEAGDR